MFEASIVSFICAQYSKALPFVMALAVMMMIFEQLCIIYHLSTHCVGVFYVCARE